MYELKGKDNIVVFLFSHPRRARTLVVSDLRSQTKCFWYGTGWWLCAEESSLQ